MNRHGGNQFFQDDAFGESGLDFFFVRRHFLTGAAIEDGHALDSGLADRYTRRIHGRVAAADDPDATVRHRLAFKVVGLEELDARDDPGCLFARQIKFLAGVGSGRDENGLIAILE